MGFFAEDSSLIVTHILYKAALVLALLRCALSWALKLWNDTLTPPTSRHSPSTQQIRDRLILTTFGDVADRKQDSDLSDAVAAACAVCLNQMKAEDEVRELRNCCHVFHKDCIDRWIDHELDDQEEDESNHRTCPLCRTPLLTASQSLDWTAAAEHQQQPSWAVERILYLFGDDLPFSICNVSCKIGK
ncbi:Brassinosteroid-responsive RING protein 1 [Linum perenne]